MSLQKLYASSSKKESSKKKSDENQMSYPETYNEFCQATGFTGIMTETEFSAHEKAPSKYGSYKKYLKKMYKEYA